MNFFQEKILRWAGFSALIDAANWQQRYQRPYEPITANPIATDVSLSDWTMLVSDSRKLFCNLGPAKGAICDKAIYSVGRAWDAKFCGEDREWGKKAEEWVNENWYPVADVRGGMFDFKSDLYTASVSIDRDGEVYVFLTQSPDGWPQIQLIPATQIGQRDTEGTVKDGPYAGLRLVQGIIFNENGRAVAYRVLGETSDKDVDYSARDLIQVFDPEWADQVRGFPAFTHALLDLKDLRTTQGYEKIAAMIASSIGLIEKNELGAPDPNDVMNVLRRGTQTMSDSNLVGPTAVTQNYQGVTTRFFRAGTGSGLEQLKSERPGDGWEKFMNRLIRNACAGAGWPYELTWNSAELGGANVRLLVARAMRTVEDRQDLLRPIARRAVGYAVAKAIKLGKLPSNDQWYKWDFAMPARISVDYGRDGNSDREDYKLGLSTMTGWLAEQGKTLESHIKEKVEENKKLTAAGLPVYGPGMKEATDINAPKPKDPSGDSPAPGSASET